jgi:hypothetical protein
VYGGLGLRLDEFRSCHWLGLAGDLQLGLSLVGSKIYAHQIDLSLLQGNYSREPYEGKGLGEG